MSTTTKARVTLGKRPETFTAFVSALLPEGGEGTIEVTYRYRTRKEFGELLDQRMAQAEAADAERQADLAAGKDVPALTAGDVQQSMVCATVDHILEIATGWNLPEPFEREHVTQLADELPGLARAIIDRYREAIVEGRLGN